MFPVGDELPTRRTPFVNWTLVAVCIVAFGYETAAGQLGQRLVVDTWGLVPARLLADPRGAALTLLTHQFLHADLLHLAGNMLFLWVFGDNVEDELGHLGYLLFYLAGGVCAGLASVVTRPGSDVPGIGASGAISAVLAAYLVLHPLAEVRVLLLLPWTLLGALLTQSAPIYGIPAWGALLAWFGLQLLGGLSAQFSPAGVDYGAHVGGFLAGYLAIRGLRALGLWPDEPDPNAPPRERSPMVRDYVVAARVLRAGQALSPADVRWTERRFERVEPDVVPATSLADVVGRRLRVDRYPLEPISWSDLEPAETATSEPGRATPEPGERASPS